jgi:glycosyltransferase involved in cell wall biosynthesis
MPTYQGVRWVGDSIESVLAQTYEQIELVVVDDASTDSTPEIVTEYARREPDRVRLVRNSDRAGPCRRRNDAIAAARGDLIAWIDQDDLWLPTKTARQVEVLENEPEVGVVYSRYETFDSETGERLAWGDPSEEAEGDILVPLFVNGCFIASLTALFRREVLTRRALRLRETDFSFGDDYFLWLTLALDWRVVRLNEVLARYRRHPGSESVRLAQTNFHLRRIALLREFLETFPEARRKLGVWRRRGLANHYLMAADFERTQLRPFAVFRYTFAALRLDPRGTVRAVVQG